MELPKVAASYSQNLVSEARSPKDFLDRMMNERIDENAKQTKALAASILAATELLANATSHTSQGPTISL